MDVTDPSTTTLTINVTREEFENKVYIYRCFTFDSNLGFINDPNRVISNEVTVDPPGESGLVYIIHTLPAIITCHLTSMPKMYYM